MSQPTTPQTEAKDLTVEQKFAITLQQQVQRCLMSGDQIVKLIVKDAAYLPIIDQVIAHFGQYGPMAFLLPPEVQETLAEPYSIAFVSDLEQQTLGKEMNRFINFVNTDMQRFRELPVMELLDAKGQTVQQVPIVYEPQMMKQAILTAYFVFQLIMEKQKAPQLVTASPFGIPR